MISENIILEVKNVSKTYTSNNLFGKKKSLNALKDISFSVKKNTTLGIVGESGCGKSTLAKILTRLELLTEGEIFIEQNNKLVGHKEIKPRDFFSLVQMVFQDPYQSLNPRKNVFEILAEPLYINTSLTHSEISKQVFLMMEKVGLDPSFSKRYPHQFSGGQRQRIGIARAIILRPKILILDEPVSALDVSIQASILNLLNQLQKEFELTYIFISHDLSVIQHMSDQIMAMYLGQIVEIGKGELVFNNPLHPYSNLLLESIPGAKTKVIESKNNFDVGEMPNPFQLPIGCSFYSRCSEASEKCKNIRPNLKPIEEERMVACHLY